MDFILQIILLASAGVIVYLFARALPRVSDDDIAPPSKIWLRIEEFFRSLPLQKIDIFVNGILEKFLRKFRVIILKIENIVNAGIHKVKSGKKDINSDGGVSRDLFEKK